MKKIISVIVLPVLLQASCTQTKQAKGPSPLMDMSKPPLIRQYNQARLLFEQEKYSEAENMFAEVYKIQPKLKNALYNLALSQEMQGKYEEALKTLEKSLQQDDLNLELLTAYSRICTILHKEDLALKVVNTKLKSTKEHPEPLLLIKAGLQRSHGKPQRSIKTARKIILRDQKNLTAMKIIGLSYTDMGKYDLAETFYRNAMKIAKDDPSLLNNIGVIQYKRGNHRAALETFNKSLAIQEDNAIANANIGLISLHFRDYVRAQEKLELAIKSGLKDCITLKALGYAQQGLQSGEQAIASLKEAQGHCSNEPELLFDIAQITMMLLRDNATAKELFKEYLEKKQGKRIADAKQALETIKQLEQAQSMMEKAQDESQDNPEDASPSNGS